LSTDDNAAQDEINYNVQMLHACSNVLPRHRVYVCAVRDEWKRKRIQKVVLINGTASCGVLFLL